MEQNRDVPVRVIEIEGRKYLVLRWRDPETGKTMQRSAKTNNKRAARREADRLELAFADGSELAAVCTWETFCERYDREHASMLSEGSRKAWRTIRRHVDRILAPKYVRELNSTAIAKFVGALRTGDEKHPAIRVTSIDSYLGQLAAALSWGKRNRLVAEMPMMPDLPRVKGRSKFARSRPITLEELERILLVVEKVRPDDADQWSRFIRGLAESGMRLHELLRLSWDFGDGLWIDQTGRYPVIRISSGAEKAHTDRVQPITEEFWRLIQPVGRSGRVFPLYAPDGSLYQKHWVTKIVSRIGAKAGVVTNPEDGKCATSHDIGRRFFATRMASKMTTLELKDWMRHESVETTARYYAIQEAESLASRFWNGDTHGDTDRKTETA